MNTAGNVASSRKDVAAEIATTRLHFRLRPCTAARPDTRRVQLVAQTLRWPHDVTVEGFVDGAVGVTQLVVELARPAAAPGGTRVADVLDQLVITIDGHPAAVTIHRALAPEDRTQDLVVAARNVADEGRAALIAEIEDETIDHDSRAADRAAVTRSNPFRCPWRRYFGFARPRYLRRGSS